MNYRNIYIDQAQDFSTILYHRTGNGVPVDITGWTFTAAMRRNPESIITYAITATISDGPTGAILLTMPESNTAMLEPGAYEYAIQANHTTKTLTHRGTAFVNSSPVKTYVAT